MHPQTPVPLPTGDVWVQYPLVALVMACLIVCAVGIFLFTKWIWGQYKVTRAEELAWRKEQDVARDNATAEQNRLWREAVAVRDARYERYDRERQGTLTQLVESMAGIVKQIQDHDAQAKEILLITRQVDENTRPAKKE